MRRCRVLVLLAGAAAVCAGLLGIPGVADAGAVSAVMAAPSAASPWGTPVKVSGLAALRKGGTVEVLSVSCASAGRCRADGFYSDSSGRTQGFAAREDNGVWGKPVQLPGLPALNKLGAAGIDAISCPAPRTCTAGGAYTDRSGHKQAFVTKTS